MARPKNFLVVLPDNTVISVAPSKLKAFLEATSNGVSTSLGGKVVGTVNLTMGAVTQDNAKAVLSSMFPDEVGTVAAPAMTDGSTPAPEALAAPAMPTETAAVPE
jgi:hypothetical protein